MNNQILFDRFIIGWFALAAFVFCILQFISAPYGRHARSGWGPTVDATVGWIVMEAPASIGLACCFGLSGSTRSITAWTFVVLWQAHYLHRAFLYPFTLMGKSKPMPWSMVLLGLVFNTTNSLLHGAFLFFLSEGYSDNWICDPRFIVGTTLFVIGYVVNRQSDAVLTRLRSTGDTSYKIPHGSMYQWISCPNYFGEIVLWIGWAIATWSLPGLAFSAWTVANLAPRAKAHHLWYRNHFADYPVNRKALIPWLW
jgi:3-oxo-5-alpha-steroid 4-dehydrogenase 1